MITSLGFHTFTIVLRLTFGESRKLYRNFQEYRDRTGEVRIRPINWDKRYPKALPKGYAVEYVAQAKGIRWYIRFNDELSNFVQMSDNPNNPHYQVEPKEYSVRATINPKIFTGISNYLTAANSDCLEGVETQFNNEAEKISPILGKFEEYSLNRIDYCLNLDLKEIGLPCTSKQMITLMKRGNIPRHFHEWTEYDKKSHRQRTNKNSFYLQSKSVTLNIYGKHEQLLSSFPDNPDLEASSDLIRFEIQAKYPKVYSMSRPIQKELRSKMTSEEYMDDPQWGVTNPVKEMLSDQLSENVIRNYFDKVIGKGDYLTLDAARWMVEAHDFRRDKKERLIFALETVNECRSIAKAKEKLLGDDLRDFKRSLTDLHNLQINPVTIPREWNIVHIPNPLRAYYDSITEYQIVPHIEILFKDLLEEYLS